MRVFTAVFGACLAVCFVALPHVLLRGQCAALLADGAIVVLAGLLISGTLEGTLRVDPGADTVSEMSWRDFTLNVCQGVSTLVSLQACLVSACPTTLQAITLVGASLMLVGIVLRVWAIRTLGARFTDGVIAEGSWCHDGPYQWLRHPAEYGGVLVFFGFAVGVGAPWQLVAITLTVLSALAVYRIRREEEEATAISGNLALMLPSKQRADHVRARPCIVSVALR
jgi:protein-S-isoprenylcysteine O-methyltransferase Ste14